MAYIGRNPAIGTQKVLDSLESQFNGSKVTFDLRYNSNTIYPPIASALIVSLGGVLQEPGVAYTVTSDTITFASAPPIGTDCWILLYTEFGRAADSATNFSVSNNLTIGNELHGPANFIIDPATIGDNTGTVEIKGNLTVQGTQTTVNSTTVDLDHLSLGDGEIANFGTDNDLRIYHSGNVSRIYDTSTNLQIAGSIVELRNSGTNEVMIAAYEDDRVELYYDSSKKLETTNTGIDVTGHTETDTLNVSGISTFQGNVHLGDNDRLRIGDGNDLELYHDGTDDLIRSSGTTLKITGTRVVVNNAANNANQAVFTAGGSVALYHNASKKFETTSSGIDVTGHTETDTLRVSGIATFTGSETNFEGLTKITRTNDGQALQLINTSNANNAYVDQRFNIDGHSRASIRGQIFGANLGGLLRFYTAANSQVLTERAVIDYNGRFGINVTSPTETLDVGGTTQTQQLNVTGVSTFANTISVAETIQHTGDTNTSISFPSNDYIRLTTSGSSRLNATPNGYILLGTNSEPSGGDAHARNARLVVQGRIGNTADSGRLNLQRGSSTSNGSSIGSITFTDNSNNAYARIETLADAAPGTNDYPGRIVFSTTPDGSASPTESLRITSAGYVSIPDDSGRFTAGSSNDLQIYHDGSNSYVEDVGTGALIMKGSTVRIRSTTNENMLSASQNGAISLYYDNSVKLETTSTGIDVTGKTDTDTLNVSGLSTLQGTLEFDSTLQSYDPAGGGGSDTSTNAAIALPSGKQIVGVDDGYIRSLLSWSDSSNIIIGQQNTSKIQGIQLKPGTNAGVGLHYGGSGDNLKFRTTSTGVDVLGTITASSDGSNPIILVKGSGPNFIRFASDSSGTVDADSIDFVYRATPNTLGFERSSDGTTFWTTDADTGVTNFNYTPTVSGSSIFNASNLNAGTIPDARIPDVITPTTRVQTQEIRANGTQLVLNAGEAAGKFSGQTAEKIYLNSEGGTRISTPTGGGNFESGYVTNITEITGQGIFFHNGTTRIGEITTQDTTWLRINQTTAKNIYTPRYIRADGGLFVDGTAKGINGSGNFIGGTIAGASDVTDANTANTVVKRNGSSDINCRLVRQSYQNQSTISGGIVYRINNGNDNYLRVCNSPSAIRTFLGVTATGSDGNYLRANATDTATGTLTFNGLVNIRTGLDFADGDFIRMGSSDDWTATFNNNNWLYINQKGNGIIFQDNGTGKMVLEDSGIFRPHSNNQGAIGTTTHRWNIVYAYGIRSQSQGSPGHNNSTTGYALSSTGAGYFSRSGGEALYCNRNQNGGIVRFGRSGSEKGQIVMNTNSVSYQTTSDYRLKENVVALENGIERVKQLKPYRFNFIDDPNETLDGFLAHEAQEVVHECASGTKDEMKGIGTLTEWDGTTLETDVVEPDELTWEETITDEEGNETTQTRTRTWTQTGTQPVHQGIDQAKLVPLLTAALQEAITKIEQLEARITQLEST
ncbi:virion structural protein and packaging [Cyanophage S-TIM5]|uniref:Virion structural protein and packaging n=1 Tax=Cyanophage S-TIM5 TaxID=1137745 RepID=H6WFW0_9CAUD|nr:virion structural protein and packaging [Cyanophage S-TIM5]AEZ65685.1 virion structural protein and packaging [Cyanophage S-TIM5]UYE97065.1 virion structural protein [Cyanophage S-TIM61]